jgi:uncharacterized protein YbjT (DUF2867 family)
MTILVTGATGNVGRNVVDLLLETGVPVRATSRRPQSAGLPAAVDVRAADLQHPETFADALAGAEKVFLFPDPSAVDGFVEVAKGAGVKHIVLLSSIATTLPESGDNPIQQRHLIVERALEKSGIDWTFLRPGAFATNTLRWAQSIKEGTELRIPYAEANMAPIHERDIAAVAVTALIEDGHAGAAYTLTGPESITHRRQAELIGSAIGRSVSVVDLTGDDARTEVLQQFGPYGTPQLVDGMLNMYIQSVGTPADVSDAVERVTGRPGRTYAEWAVEHKADFAG